MSRVALVTGAASGIGAAVSAELTDHGWLVAGLDLRRAPHLAFLASPRLGALIGQTIQINGGSTRCRV